MRARPRRCSSSRWCSRPRTPSSTSTEPPVSRSGVNRRPCARRCVAAASDARHAPTGGGRRAEDPVPVGGPEQGGAGAAVARDLIEGVTGRIRPPTTARHGPSEARCARPRGGSPSPLHFSPRLVYSHGGETEEPLFHGTVTFTEEGGRTRVDMHSVWPTAQALAEGGQQTLPASRTTCRRWRGPDRRSRGRGGAVDAVADQPGRGARLGALELAAVAPAQVGLALGEALRAFLEDRLQRFAVAGAAH